MIIMCFKRKLKRQSKLERKWNKFAMNSSKDNRKLGSHFNIFKKPNYY